MERVPIFVPITFTPGRYSPVFVPINFKLPMATRVVTTRKCRDLFDQVPARENRMNASFQSISGSVGTCFLFLRGKFLIYGLEHMVQDNARHFLVTVPFSY
jgi:hypothetical protein